MEVGSLGNEGGGSRPSYPVAFGGTQFSPARADETR